MRRLGDLLAGEPLAITGAVTATANVLFLLGVGDLSPEVVAGVNVMIGAWFSLLRWLVVPTAVAAEQADVAGKDGYQQALADVNELPPAKPKKK